MNRKYQVGGSHYTKMKLQPWDVMESCLTTEQYTGYHLATIMVYLMRYNSEGIGKGGMQDLRKAHHHLTKLIEWKESDVEKRI